MDRSSDYEDDDYDNDTYNYVDDGAGTGMCNKTWVRQFQGRYEPPLFWIIFVLGALGNLMVVWIYLTVRNRIKTMTDMFLLNLAVADLCFLSTLPVWAMESSGALSLDVSSCKLVSSIYKVNVFSSMLLLSCISVDRYIAIVHATSRAQDLKKRGLLYSLLSCLLVWLLSILLAFPELIHAQARTNHTDRNVGSRCVLVYSSNTNNQVKIAVLSLQVCMGFLVPLLVLMACYSAIIRKLLQARSFQKHKALRVIFAVVLVFIVSQLPHNILLIMETSLAADATMDCPSQSTFNVAQQISKSLSYLHACLNPVLYAFIGVRFRQDLLKIAKTCAGRLSQGRLQEKQSLRKRASLMSDTDTTAALSL